MTKIDTDYFEKTLETGIKNETYNQIYGLFHNKEFAQFIKNKTLFLDSGLSYTPTASMRIWHIVNNTDKIPKCQQCNGEVKFLTLGRGYCNTCCKKCQFGPVYLNNLKNSVFDKYGVENVFQNKEIKEKIKQTNQERHGVDYPSQSSEIREKSKAVWMETLGVDNPNKSPEVRNKTKQTCMEIFGVENPFQNEEIKDKIKKTNLFQLNVEYPSQSPEVRIKINQTNIDRYGVENVSQNAEIHERASKSSFRRIEYVMPSGKIVKLQGYENYTLDLLLKTHDESDLIVSQKEIENITGKIWYISENNKIARYFPDLYCISENKIYETKSDYTFSIDITENLLKKEACLDMGLDFEFVVFNKQIERIL